MHEMPRPLLACARGELAPNVALMQMVAEADSPDRLEAGLRQAIGNLAAKARPVEQCRLQAMLDLWCGTPRAWSVLRAVLTEVGHRQHEGGVAAISDWSGIFDRVCALSPEAGVALYSLGRSDLLEAATVEIVASMRQWGLLGQDRILLEIGCGMGRFLRALSGEARLVVGIDISSCMLSEAARRGGAAAGAALVRTSGRDLGPFRTGSFDLVYAIDAFPYLVDAGVAASHIAEVARLLRPGGQLLILNYSYRGDRARDRGDIAELAGRCGFSLLQNGGGGLRYWDGEIFRLRKG